MIDRIEGYLATLLSVAELPADGDKAEELRAHLTDAVAAYRQEGLSPAEATERALAAFGDAETAGRQLREVTSLPVTRRDWVLTAALTLGITLSALALSGRFPASSHPLVANVWMSLVILATGWLAATLSQPLLAFLAPMTANFLVWMINMVSFWHTNQPALNASHLWRAITSPSVNLRSAGFILAFLATSLIVAGLRRKLVLTPDRFVAFIAQLLPFVCLFSGQIVLVPVIGVATVTWVYGRKRSTFVERHAVQGAAVSLGLLALLYLAGQVFANSYQIGVEFLYPAAVGWALLRVVLTPVVLYAPLSALSGHDFRYPFARLLSRKRRLLPLR
ncbi:MAG TPA: permease prefix domain 1-containing protein [Symbiobacteriaceae bacterium]|jgi:hypothetical protein